MSGEITREECERHKAQDENEHNRIWDAIAKLTETGNRDDVMMNTALTTLNKTLEFQGAQIQALSQNVGKLQDGNGHGPIPFRLVQAEQRVAELWPLRHKVANIEHGLQLTAELEKEVRALKADKVTLEAVNKSGKITRKDITLILIRYLFPSLINIIGLGLLAWFMIAQRGFTLFGGGQ